MISVIHLDDGRGWRGGQHQVSLLTEGLAGLGIEQRVLARPEEPLATRLVSKGIEVIPMKFHGEWDPFAPRRIARLARLHGANILHAHTAHAHTLALRARRVLAADRNRPTIHFVSTRRVDFPVGRGFFSRRKYLDPNQHFIAISRAIREELIRGGVEPSRIDLVPSGVPPIPPEAAWSRERVRREFGIGENDLAILSVGALTDHKGHRYLIEAVPRVLEVFPRARVWILGEGELRRELESLIASLGLSAVVRLAGHVPEARFKLAGFDLFVSASHLEGLGTAILDAMLAGLPVAAAAAGGVTDIVRDGGTGRLAVPRNPIDLARVMIEMAQTPEPERARMIANARADVNDRFSAARMTEGVLQVYKRLVAP